MRRVKPANFAPLLAGAFVITAIAAFAFLSARGYHAEAVTTITINVSDSKFCTPAQSPCPDSPLDTTVAASVGDTISFKLLVGSVLPHTSSHCLDDTFTDCDDNLFDFDGGTGGNGDWLIPGSVNNSNVYFECNIHAFMQGLIVVGSPGTPTPTPVPTPTPAPTPTPEPVSVGGIADFPDIDQSPVDGPGSSGGSSFVLAALVSGLAVALAMFAAGAWYARTRWLSWLR